MSQARDVLVLAKPVGPRCNLRCAYCYYLGKGALFPASEPWRMSDALLERFIAERLRTSPSTAVHFEWHGGEPTLLGLDGFERIVALERKHARDSQVVTNGLQTNGVLLDERWADFLAAEGFSVGLSLDGPAELHDRFRTTASGQPSQHHAVRAFRRLTERGVHCDVLCVVHADNVREPDRVYRFFRELGVRYLQLLPLVEPLQPGGSGGRSPDTSRRRSGAPPARRRGCRQSASAPVSTRTARPAALGAFLCRLFDLWIGADLGRIVVQLFDEAFRASCGLPHALCIHREVCGDVLVLEHDGSLYACDHFVDPDHRLGNVRDQALDEVTANDALQQFGERKRDALPSVCRRCDVLAWCNGGCPKDRIGKTADGERGLSYLCPAYQRFFRHARPVLAELAAHWRAGLPLTSFRSSTSPAVAARSASVGPNDPCPCGSGRKYKKCCR
jgi:uncharacterized protein